MTGSRNNRKIKKTKTKEQLKKKYNLKAKCFKIVIEQLKQRVCKN